MDSPWRARNLRVLRKRRGRLRQERRQRQVAACLLVMREAESPTPADGKARHYWDSLYRH